MGRLIYLLLLAAHVVAEVADSEVSESVAQQIVQPELEANTPNVEVDNQEGDDDDINDDMDERDLSAVEDESELDDELDDEFDDGEEDNVEGHIEDGELNEGPDDDVEDNVDERNLRRRPGWCWHNKVPKDGWGHLDLKEARKCRRCRDRRDTICHARHKIHGQFCRTQCKKGFHPSVKRTQCLNGRFHPRWWRCLRNHRHRRTWKWCPRDHQKGAPFCIHAGTRSRECDPTHCCWKRGRGCLMTHFSSSSSVGAIILWVLLALLLLGAGVFGGSMALGIGTPKISVSAGAEVSDDE